MISEVLLNRVDALIFDGDDTLWSTEPLYDSARIRARGLVEKAGYDGARWEELERKIDVENVAQMGFSSKRFPTSCVQAYRKLSMEEMRSTDPGIVGAIRRAARSVFERKARVLPQARETLAYFRRHRKKLALLTKGDPAIQCKRVETSGLTDLFDMIEIVPEKSPEAIRSVTDRLGVAPGATCMVGNSLRSDILPALEAGLQAVWINAHVWEYEHVLAPIAATDFVTLARLADLMTSISDEALV